MKLKQFIIKFEKEIAISIVLIVTFTIIFFVNLTLKYFKII